VRQWLFMVSLMLVLVMLALGFATTSHAADPLYRLRFMAVCRFLGPCPDWEVVDAETGEKFYAVMDFSHLARPPSPSNDLVAEGGRTRLHRPSDGGTYERFSVSAIVKETPSIPGYRP
jgi:hypothetical protein